jgi:catechol 2,3-dioxygenase-like lactoylglutathione lyase family enzyme
MAPFEGAALFRSESLDRLASLPGAFEPFGTRKGRTVIDFSRADLDVGMVAKDVAAMLHFYGSVIGLPAAGQMKLPGRGVIHKFVVGTNLVKVFESDTPLEEGPPTIYPWTRSGSQYWSVHVGDVDAIASRLSESGVVPVEGVVDTGMGIKYMLVADPDGNIVEFIEGDGAHPPKADVT